MVVRLDPKNVAFAGAGSPQGSLDVPEAIHRICGHPTKRHIGCQRTPYHIDSQVRLGSEAIASGTWFAALPDRRSSFWASTGPDR